MNDYFERMGQEWVAAAKRRGAAIAVPRLDSRVALELLELARVTAHTQERRFAPLASYLAGVAAASLRLSRPELDDAALAEYVQEVRKVLEADAPA